MSEQRQKILQKCFFFILTICVDLEFAGISYSAERRDPIHLTDQRPLNKGTLYEPHKSGQPIRTTIKKKYWGRDFNS